MNEIINRIGANWRTTVGGILSVAGVILAALNQGSANEKWILTATAIVSGLTALLAKDTAK